MHVQHSSERLRASTKRGRGAQPPKKFVDLDGKGGCGIKDKHKCLTGEYTGIKFDIVRHYICALSSRISCDMSCDMSFGHIVRCVAR